MVLYNCCNWHFNAFFCICRHLLAYEILILCTFQHFNIKYVYFLQNILMTYCTAFFESTTTILSWCTSCFVVYGLWWIASCNDDRCISKLFRIPMRYNIAAPFKISHIIGHALVHLISRLHLFWLSIVLYRSIKQITLQFPAVHYVRLRCTYVKSSLVIEMMWTTDIAWFPTIFLKITIKIT